MRELLDGFIKYLAAARPANKCPIPRGDAAESANFIDLLLEGVSAFRAFFTIPMGVKFLPTRLNVLSLPFIADGSK